MIGKISVLVYKCEDSYNLSGELENYQVAEEMYIRGLEHLLNCRQGDPYKYLPHLEITAFQNEDASHHLMGLGVVKGIFHRTFAE